MANAIYGNSSGQFGASSFSVSDVNGQAAYKTIQAALTDSATAGGGTIIIKPGTYTENIVWPSGVTVSGSSTGTLESQVIISGTQTFNSTGDLSFQNLFFTSSAATWTIGNSAAGASSVEFSFCSIQSTGGNAVTVSSAAGSGNAYFTDSSILSITGNALSLSNGLSQSNNSSFTSTGSDAVSIGVGGTFEPSYSTFDAAVGNDIIITDASASCSSMNNVLSAGNSSFEFTANGFVKSIYDEIDANGTFLATSTSPFTGTLTYSYMTLSGTAQTIDPNITAVPLPVKGNAIIWNDIAFSSTVNPNTGTFATSGISLLLPPSPSQGDTCSFSVDTASIVSVSANAGQTIRIGATTSSVAGTAASTLQGDALYLVYRSTDTTWIALSEIGNWLLT